MTDLDLIAQIDAKIHQLPAEVLAEVDDYVSFLLLKYRDVPMRQSVNLEQREKAEQFLAQLRPTCVVGDVISPIDEVWDAAS